MSNKQYIPEFETWLRETCFQKPPKHSYELAKMAWKRSAGPEQHLLDMLVQDNKLLREAGNNLAESAFRVATEYDGVHRLMLGVSEWATAIANEGGRQKMHKNNLMVPEPPPPADTGGSDYA